MNSVWLKKISLLLLLFLFIYSPPFRLLPLNISAIITIFAYLHIFSCGRVGEIIKLFKIELVVLFFVASYSLFVSIPSGSFGFTDSFLLLFFNLPVCFWFFYFFKNIYGHEETYENLVKVLGFLAACSAVISIYLWLNQDMGNYVKFDVLKYNRDMMVHQMHRGFGLSDELLFSYSLVQGCILLLVLASYGLNKFSVALTFLVFFSIALNGRIGFVLFVLLFALPSIWKYKNARWFLVFIFIVVFSKLFFEMEGVFNFAINQFEYFYNDLIGAHENYNTLSVLFGEMIFLPEDPLVFLFGSGENIFYRTAGGSDVGYMIILHYGGVVYFLLILIFFLVCFARICIIKGKVVPIFIITFMVFIALFKGLFFAPKPGMHMFLVVYVFLVFSNFYEKFKTEIEE